MACCSKVYKTKIRHAPSESIIVRTKLKLSNTKKQTNKFRLLFSITLAIMNQLQMLQQLHTRRLLLLMDKTDESRASLAQAEKRCCATTTTAWGAGGEEEEEDKHDPDEQHDQDEGTRNSRVDSTNEDSSLFRSTSCTLSNQRISTTTNPSCFLSRISPSSSYFSSHPSPGLSIISSSTSKKRRRIVIKSPDNKMPRISKTQRFSEPRNVEAPKCRSLFPNVGINHDSSSSIGTISIESADDDFFGFEDLEFVW
jgi:hypothetical protein